MNIGINRIFDKIPCSGDDLFRLFRSAFDGMAIWEPNPWRIAYANSAFWKLVGALDEPHADPSAADEVPPALRAHLEMLLDQFSRRAEDAATTERLVSGPDHQPIEIRFCHVSRDGERLIGTVLRALAGDASSPRGSSNTTRRDPLTGLPDREFLMDRLAKLLAGERAIDHHFAVVFLDLDNFKCVNDSYGHLVGDDVLREAARRIAGCLREEDQVVRFGGDEFVALVHGVTALHEVTPVISRIQLAFSSPIAVPDGELTLSLSAGTALASESGGSPEELLAAADRAMYQAKRANTQSPVCDG